MADVASVTERLETAQALAWKLFRQCRKADSAFRAVRSDVRTLHTTLLDVHDDVSHSTAFHGRFEDGDTREELSRATDTCLTNLETLSDLLQSSWSGNKIEYLQDVQMKIQKDIQNLQQIGSTIVGDGSAPMSRRSSNKEMRADVPAAPATPTRTVTSRSKKGAGHQPTVEDCEDVETDPSPAIERYQILPGAEAQAELEHGVQATTVDQTKQPLQQSHSRKQSRAESPFNSGTAADTGASPGLMGSPVSVAQGNGTSEPDQESRRPSEIPQLVLPQKERRSTRDMEDEIARLEKENRRMRRRTQEREERRSSDEDRGTRHDSLTPDTTSRYRHHGRPRSRTTGSLSPGSSDDYDGRRSPLGSPRLYGEDARSDRYREDRERRKRHTPHQTPRHSPRTTPKHSPTSPRHPPVLHYDGEKPRSSRRRSSERVPRSPRTPRLEIRQSNGRTSSNESSSITPQSAGGYSPRHPVDVFNEFMRKEDGVPGHDFPLFSDGSDDEKSRPRRTPPSPKADSREKAEAREPVQSKLPVSLEDLFNGCTKKVIVPRTKYDSRTGSEVSDDKSMDVTIPKGLRTGTRFQYRSIVGDMESLRDLQLVIVEKPHPTFVRKDNNLEMKIDIDLLESLLGWERVITTICGRAIKVGDRKPTPPLWRVQVPNFGMPLHNNPSERGDLIVGVNIRYPALLAPSQKDALRAALTPRYTPMGS